MAKKTIGQRALEDYCRVNDTFKTFKQARKSLHNHLLKYEESFTITDTDKKGYYIIGIGGQKFFFKFKARKVYETRLIPPCHPESKWVGKPISKSEMEDSCLKSLYYDQMND